MKVVIQCGGKGTRLRPYTMVLPKPLMPVQSQPVLELLHQVAPEQRRARRLHHDRIPRPLIKSFCGDGRQWDMTHPLHRGGAAARDDRAAQHAPGGARLDLHGDQRRRADRPQHRRSSPSCHRRNGAMVTVATAEPPHPDGLRRHRGRERPDDELPREALPDQSREHGHLLHGARDLPAHPDGVPFGFDDLALCLLSRGQHVHTYRHEGLWLDIGRIDDFQSAQTLDWDDQAPAREPLQSVA